jgi:CheY-like chemotaxis protein
MLAVIVDDNQDSRQLYEAWLGTVGINTKCFASGIDALKWLEIDGNSPDAIILDLSMPVLDGLTVAEEIRRNEQLHSKRNPVKLAFFTAKNIDDAILRVAERNQVDRIFHKPEDMEEIVDWLNG